MPFETEMSVPLALITDDHLSFEARGLFCWLQATPDAIRLPLTDIAAHGNTTVENVEFALDELAAYGYLPKR
ncbi:hypothetical protein [Desertimonas flava]|uniref:hypothetical protein n=1 Tax=Desertimonas flava TaxID=2064846 RepID=UPI0013C42226|nr:hypothetical protein [Desertimonas flava]